VPHSGPGLCRTVETIGFECGLKPLGASNIGSNSKSCSHSTRKQQGLFNRTSVGTATTVHRTEITAWAVHKVRENSESCSSDRVAAKAVHQTEWQRKLFIRTSGSESCSSDRVAAKAVHQNEWQRKLFIRTSGSKSCSSDRVAAKAVHQNEYQQAVAARAVTEGDTDGGSRGCPLRETSADSESCRPAVTAEAVDRIRRPAAASGGGDRRRHPAAVERRWRKLSTARS
jgi:hypothetical protein